MHRKAFFCFAVAMMAAGSARAQYEFDWVSPSTDGAVNPSQIHCHVFPGRNGVPLDPAASQVFTIVNQTMPKKPDGTANRVTIKCSAVWDLIGDFDDCLASRVTWPQRSSNPYGDTMSITLTVTGLDGTKETSGAITVIRRP